MAESNWTGCRKPSGLQALQADTGALQANDDRIRDGFIVQASIRTRRIVSTITRFGGGATTMLGAGCSLSGINTCSIFLQMTVSVLASVQFCVERFDRTYLETYTR